MQKGTSWLIVGTASGSDTCYSLLTVFRIVLAQVSRCYLHDLRVLCQYKLDMLNGSIWGTKKHIEWSISMDRYITCFSVEFKEINHLPKSEWRIYK